MWLFRGFLAILGCTCISIIIYLRKIFKMLPPKDPKGKEPGVNNEETTRNKEETKSIDMDTDDKNKDKKPKEKEKKSAGEETNVIKEETTSTDKKGKCVDMDTDAKKEGKTPKGKEKAPAGKETNVKNEKKTYNEEKTKYAGKKKKFKEKEKTSTWQQKKSDFENMSVEEKRVHYCCGRDYVMLESISPWPDYVVEKQLKFVKKESVTEDDVLNKVSLWRGDITHLEIDAIVNAANTSLLGGGGVDGCIHRAAGKCLYEECYTLNGCETGKAKITSGYKLPAKYVIHTVGPIGENKLLLKSCYESCLSLVKGKKLESVAFCCISTGIYGYPIENATDVALMTVKDWLENNKSWAGRIIFCVFSKDDLHVYEKKMLKYFPFTKKTNEQMIVDNDGKPKVTNELNTESKSNDKDEKSELTNKNPSEKEVGRQPNPMDMTSGQEYANNNSPEDGGESVVMGAASEEMTDAGSGSETSDGNGGRIKRKLKSPNVDIKAKASADKDKDGKSGFNLPKFHMPKFGFGSSGKSKRKSSKKGKKKGFEMEGDVKLPSGEVEGDIPKVSIDTDLQNEPPSLSYSGSDTSDGHGGRIKRKLKLPSGDINISGGLKGPKGDADSSDSDTSDGKGGRIKRKAKMRNSTEDAKYSSSISPKRMKFKLPKFGFGGSKKEKNAEIVKEVDSSSSEDQLVLDKFEIPNFDIDVKTVSSDASKEFKIDLEQKPAPVVISASQEKPVFTGPTRQSSASGDLISSTDISMNADITGESVTPYGSAIVCDEKFTRTSRVLPDLQYDVDYGDIDFGDVDSDFQLPLSQIESNISVSSEGGGLYSAPSGGIYADFDKNNDGQQERKIHQKPSGPLVFEDITRSSRDKPDISHDVDFSTIDFDFDVPSIQVKQNSGVSPALPKEKGKIEVNAGPTSSFLSNINTSTTSYSTTSVTKSVTLKTTVDSKVESGADVNDLDTQINAMEPGDITELIRSSSRSGRLSLETKGVGNSRRPVSMDVSKSGARTLLSIANSQRSLSSENIKEETTRRPKSVTVILKEDDGKMAASASVSTPKSPSMRVYTKQGNPDVGLQGLKEIAVEERHGGLDRVSVQKQVSSSTTSSSRTTVTTQTYIRQGPSSPSSYPELLDKEIRQVKASSEKGSDTLEERRRWSMEKRSQWMLSSPKSDSDGGEEKRLTLRDRKKLQQVDDESKNEPIKR